MGNIPDIHLNPGEKGLVTKTFVPNLLLPFLKTVGSVTDRRVVVKCPSFPVGYREITAPLTALSSVGVSVVYKGFRLFLALIFIIISLCIIDKNIVVALILGLFGVILIISSVYAQLDLVNNGGGVQSFSVALLEKGKLEQFKNDINHHIFNK